MSAPMGPLDVRAFADAVMASVAGEPAPTPARAILGAVRRGSAREALDAVWVAWHLATERTWPIAPALRVRSAALVFAVACLLAMASIAVAASFRAAIVPPTQFLDPRIAPAELALPAAGVGDEATGGDTSAIGVRPGSGVARDHVAEDGATPGGPGGADSATGGGSNPAVDVVPARRDDRDEADERDGEQGGSERDDDGSDRDDDGSAGRDDSDGADGDEDDAEVADDGDGDGDPESDAEDPDDDADSGPDDGDPDGGDGGDSGEDGDD